MKNVHEMRRELVAIFSGVKANTLDLKKAAEMNNTIGKMLGTLKVELAYAALTGRKPNIPFISAARGKRG